MFEFKHDETTSWHQSEKICTLSHADNALRQQWFFTTQTIVGGPFVLPQVFNSVNASSNLSLAGHWVNKDASAWSKAYFESKLTHIKAEENGVTAEVDNILDVDGDVDVSQRKGKVITLYDIKIRLEFSGKTADDKEVGGTITIPEVAHDTTEDEYVFEISIYSESKEKEPVRELIKKSVVPQLRKALAGFTNDLIEQHGKDIQHGSHRGDSKSPPGFSDSKAASTVQNPVELGEKQKSSTTKPSPATERKPLVNTSTVSDVIEFSATAAELYQTFIDPQRVAAFTRAPPRVFEPKEGGKFALFGGNVEGEFSVLEEGKKIAQKWRMVQWVSGHYSTLTLLFDQGYDTTSLRYTWEGIPIGQEEVVKRNFTEYYVKPIKVTFGFGSVL